MPTFMPEQNTEVNKKNKNLVSLLIVVVVVGLLYWAFMKYKEVKLRSYQTQVLEDLQNSNTNDFTNEDIQTMSEDIEEPTAKKPLSDQEKRSILEAL